ncbi:MAG: WG repeat-containing protein [Bacteroidales bacterium]|nr:WG repeat-containing protein [Bacteroidales bacterium]
MEKNEKNQKSTWLTRRILNISLKWQIIGILLIAVGVFATVKFLFDTAVDWYDVIKSDRYYVSNYIGDNYEVHNYYDGHKSIAESETNHIVLEDIEWVNGDDSDSLWVVAKDERRAYFNSQSGQLETPFVYRKAWRYSEGLAAVVDENHLLRFIDPQGNPAFKHTFFYNQERYYDYLFHNQMCPIVDSFGKVGMIDKTGKWIVEAKYDSIAFVNDTEHGYWSLMRGDSLMVIGSMGRTIIDMTPGHQLNITSDGSLEIWHELRPGKLYDTLGNILENQTYWNVKNIENYEEYGEYEGKSTDILVYYTDYEHCGLLSPDGQILTDAKYNDIESISPNLFRAKYDIVSGDGDYLFYDSYPTIFVLLNNKGELVEGKTDIANKDKTINLK